MKLKEYNIETKFNEENKFIIENFIVNKGITLIVASPKKGKTMLGLNIALCIHNGVEFLGNKTLKSNTVYYCNELSGKIVIERIKKMDLLCEKDFKLYEGIGQISFEELENMVKEKSEEGFKVFIIDTFSKIKYERVYNTNDYNDTYDLIDKYYKLIEKYGCTFIMMYHTKKDSSVKSISEKVIGSQALSGAVDTIISIDKASEKDTEFALDITSRQFESRTYQVKINPEKSIIELDVIEPVESLEPSIQKLVQAMPKLKEFEGTIVDICSKISLDIESPQQFGKTINRNKELLKKNGITISSKRGKNNNIYNLRYDANDVVY